MIFNDCFFFVFSYIFAQAYVTAVKSGVENIKEALFSPEAQQQLVPTGPRLLSHTTKARKTIDTENTDLKYLAKPDGTLVTERKQTTEHEEIHDDPLAEEDDHSTGSREHVEHKVRQVTTLRFNWNEINFDSHIRQQSSQRFTKVRDEQEVEYVADGKTVKKEMRYAAENEDMQRDGSPENESDWDSLSDRVRKARLKQKSLLQQHRGLFNSLQQSMRIQVDFQPSIESFPFAEAIQNERERKEALIKRPIDFEKEEETRKDETIKWLESHFGGKPKRSSRDPVDDDKRINVTFKGNASVTSPTDRGYKTNGYASNLQSPAKVVSPERETPKTSKYFQGISDWSERKEAAPRHLSSKAFHDELKGTLERNRMRHIGLSREEIRPPRYGKDENSKSDEEPRKRPSAKNDIRYGSRGDLHYHRNDLRGDSDDSRTLKVQREDLGYMSGSRTDIRPRHDSKDDLYAKSKKSHHTTYLHREDSGYVKDSREDVRYLRQVPAREDSFNKDSGEDEKHLKYNSPAIQRDDSAYVSSSTYFTEPRSPKTIPMRTPDSGIRSPSPEPYEADTLRPSVPQRKRLVDKKIRASEERTAKPIRIEPPPDYSRSRSISPAPSPKHHRNGGHKKMYQKTRFASSSELSRPVSTQTIETQTTPPKKNKVTSSIGNSIRKLVGKFRSASAERKLKSKSKRSASPQSKQSSKAPSQQSKHAFNQVVGSNGSTYQQYNVIDSHIGAPTMTRSTSPPSPPLPQPHANHHQQHRDRESSIVSGTARHDRTLERRVSSDNDAMAIPKQKFYLGEDPYLSMYGKENKYDGSRLQSQHNNRYRRQRSEDIDAPSRWAKKKLYFICRLIFIFRSLWNRWFAICSVTHIHVK